jgi:phosphohistidine phosphatase SixA
MYFRNFNGLVTVIVAGLLSSLALGAQALDDQSQLIKALQQGGYVVFVRHADTTGEPLDKLSRDLSKRVNQRNLSAAGRAQASAIGAAVRRFELQVGHVAASPVFRARDTAELAFGVDRVSVDDWLIADDYAAGNYSRHISKLQQYLATPPVTGNTWLVGHVVPIAIATRSEVNRSNFPEGAAAVFRPSESGFELIGILGDGWENSTL